MTSKVNWQFIEALEGKNVLKGYVPVNNFGSVIGRSGVTIATGVDLGQLSKTDLIRLCSGDSPISIPLVKKLIPYLGIKGIAACSLLQKYPLEISQEEAEFLSYKMHKRVLDRLEKTWNSYKEGLITPFAELPEQVQTVLFSLAYNFGTNLPARLPNTFLAFLQGEATGDWTPAINALVHFSSVNRELISRRKKEADYLMTLQVASNKSES